MKHLFLLFLLIPVTLFAQVDKKYLAGAVPVVDDRVVFTEELNLPGRSQNDIFATLLQWATTRFITTEELQSRILYSDQDKGQIACMGQEYLVFTNKALSLDRAVINYQMFITTLDLWIAVQSIWNFMEISQMFCIVIHRHNDERETAARWQKL